jgi:2-dehydro-3-deoxyphosphogluconate aldolase/(4S)-4-hydroxy-2-oxoglutarate aldolase
MTPQTFVDTVWRHRTTAIVRADSQDKARRAMDAAVGGGIRVVEFTLTTPGVYELIAEFAQREGLSPIDGLENLVVGAGTVMTQKQAQRAVESGAQFLVSPVADPAVIGAARELGVASIPGVHTPNEMIAAHRAGAPLLKLFPVPAGGPAFLKSALAPLPFLKVVPTNGVDEGNIADWLRAGAWGVGLVGSLFAPEDMQQGNWGAIEARAASMRAAAMSVNRHDPPEAYDPFASRDS